MASVRSKFGMGCIRHWSGGLKSGRRACACRRSGAAGDASQLAGRSWRGSFLPARSPIRRPVSCRWVGHRRVGHRAAQHHQRGPQAVPAATAGPGPGVAPGGWALPKNPEDSTVKQHPKTAWIAMTDPDLRRRYLLKQGRRLVLKMPLEQATETLDHLGPRRPDSTVRQPAPADHPTLRQQSGTHRIPHVQRPR